MMREVLERRFARLAKEGDDAGADFPSRPDLVLIDGGKGQISAARETMERLGMADIPLVGVAKGADRDAGRETFVIPGREPSACRRAIRRCSSCSGCATRRTASPSARTGPSASAS